MKKLPEEIVAKAFVSDEGKYGLRNPDIFAALQAIAETGQAILGGDVWGIENGKVVVLFPGTIGWPCWHTGLRNIDEPWPEYCQHTCKQSIRELKSIQIENEVEEKTRRFACYHPHYSEEGDPRYYIPRDKHDHARAELAIKAGYPAIAPILPELLVWLQDMNWPVARDLAPFLAAIGSPLIPHIRNIFATDDHVWKRWIISDIMEESREVAEAFKDDLGRIAYAPTNDEIEEELNEEALDLLKHYGWDKTG